MGAGLDHLFSRGHILFPQNVTLPSRRREFPSPALCDLNAGHSCIALSCLHPYKLFLISFAYSRIPFAVKWIPLRVFALGCRPKFVSSSRGFAEMKGTLLICARRCNCSFSRMHFSFTGATLPTWMIAEGNCAWYLLQALSYFSTVSWIVTLGFLMLIFKN